jgi:hypothetical protein
MKIIEIDFKTLCLVIFSIEFRRLRRLQPFRSSLVVNIEQKLEQDKNVPA